MLTWLGHRAGQGFPGGTSGKETACQPIQETMVRSLGQKDPLEKGMATEWVVFLPGKSHGQRSLQSIGLQRFRHNRSNLAHMYAQSCFGLIHYSGYLCEGVFG